MSTVSCARPTEIPKTEINTASKMNDDFTALLLNFWRIADILRLTLNVRYWG
jgi:hypothetical protein